MKPGRLLFPSTLPELAAEPAQPLVLIVMRTRDRPLLLRRALASVLAQTHTLWHLALVNDGGDQASVDALVAGHSAALGDRITVRHNPRSIGMEAASNLALSLAHGSYVAVHDDDDTWHPEFLQQTVAFLERDQPMHFIGVLTGCTVVFERLDGATVVEERREPLADAELAADLRQLLVRNRCPPICLVFRRAAVDLLQGYNPALPVLGDWEFNLRASLLGEIGTIAEPLGFWHQRKSTDGVYGNSLIATQSMHARYDQLLRNSMLRVGLQEQPELLGLMHALLHAADAQEERQLARTASVGNDVNAIGDQVRAVLERILDTQNRILAVQAIQQQQLDRALAPFRLARRVLRAPAQLAAAVMRARNGSTSWPDLIRPSATSAVAQDVDARDKPGHNMEAKRE